MALRGAPHGWGAAVSQPSATQAALCGMRGLLAGGLAVGYVEPSAAWSLTYVVLLVAGLRREVQNLIAEGIGLVWESYKLDP